MVAPNLLPGRTFDQSKLNSKLLLYWRAQDRSLTTVGSDSTGTLVRASAGGLTEGRGHFRPSSTSDVRLVGPVADNQPRWGVTSAHKPYLLLEAARTNAWSHSSQLNNAAWNKFRSSITPNAILAPDGRTAADKLVEDGSASNTHGVFFNAGTGTMTINTDQTLSFYAKAAERTWLSIFENFEGSRHSWINLTTGVVGTKHADHTITITDANLPGWWRITLVVDSGPSTSGDFIIYLNTGDVGNAYTGDGVSGFYLWGMQFEADQSFASSHIVTVASAVTRAAETLVFPFLAPPQEMTILATFVVGGVLTTAALGILSVGSGSGTNAEIDARLNTNGKIACFYTNGSSQVSTSDGALSALVANDFVEYLINVSAAGVISTSQSVNSGAIENGIDSDAQTLPATWANQQVDLAAIDGGSANGFLAFISLKIASGTKTMQQMKEAL